MAQSTCEAENIAAANAAKEALYLKQLMPEFGYDTTCIDLAVHNQGAIKVIYGQGAFTTARCLEREKRKMKCKICHNGQYMYVQNKEFST
eukprot:352249-Chlamydomonas_euryale.AAC.24